MRRYIEKKWFSLEGNEALIPLLNELLVISSADKVEEPARHGPPWTDQRTGEHPREEPTSTCSPSSSGAWAEDFVKGGGDVKYHRGYSSDIITDAAAPCTSRCHPIHRPGTTRDAGRARAKQRLRNDDQSATMHPGGRSTAMHRSSARASCRKP